MIAICHDNAVVVSVIRHMIDALTLTVDVAFDRTSWARRRVDARRDETCVLHRARQERTGARVFLFRGRAGPTCCREPAHTRRGVAAGGEPPSKATLMMTRRTSRCHTARTDMSMLLLSARSKSRQRLGCALANPSVLRQDGLSTHRASQTFDLRGDGLTDAS